MTSHPPTTPDGRYIVVRGTLWRAANPNLDPETRQHWVNALMDARRDVKRHQQDADALKQARSRVQAAKEALGERGPVWWQDGAPCLNRHQVRLTPYAQWYAALEHSNPDPKESP